MTFRAVIAGRGPDLSGACRCRSASSPRSPSGALCGFVSGIADRQLKIPPFIATLGMMLILKGLSLVISGTKPIYFNDTPELPAASRTGSLIGVVLPAAADPERRADPVRRWRWPCPGC